jgi:hypothetical protein
MAFEEEGGKDFSKKPFQKRQGLNTLLVLCVKGRYLVGFFFIITSHYLSGWLLVSIASSTSSVKPTTSPAYGCFYD